jgi:hypothetical protein
MEENMSNRAKAPMIIDRIPEKHCEGPFWGNSVLGAVLYVQGKQLCFSLDHSSLWEMRETLPDTPKAGFQEILKNQEKYLRGDTDYVVATDIFSYATGRTKLPGLGLKITLPEKIISFYAETDIQNAVTRMKLKLRGDRLLTGQIWLDSCENVFCLSFEGAKEKEITLEASGWELDNPRLRALNDWKYKKCQWEEYQSGFCMLQEFSGTQTAVLTAEQVTGQDKLKYVITMDTCESSHRKSLQKSQQIRLREYIADLKGQYYRHCRDWNAYWEGFDIMIPNERLQQAFDTEMYKLYCNERENSSPVTLQGVWNPDSRMPAWFGDLHNDLNVQSCYWPAFKTGNAKLARPYIRYYARAMKRFHLRAEKLFGIKDAIHVPTMMAPDGTGAASEWCFWNTLLGPELFVATDFCWFYEYTRDCEILREEIYPFLLGVARLYKGIAIRKEDGMLHIPFTCSPEIFKDGKMLVGDDATFTITTLHYLLKKIAEYASVLKLEAEEWAAFEEELVPVAVTDKGYPIFPDIEVFESHRHFCQLFPIYPLCEEAHSQLAEKSLDTAISQGFTEFAAFSFPYLSIMASRCSRGNMARTMLEIYCMAFRSRNTFTVNGDPYQNGVIKVADTNAGEDSDAFTLESGFFIPTALCEMFVHRAKDKVWLAAGIPEEWKKAECRGLAIEGNHRVSIIIEDYVICSAALTAGCDENLTLIAGEKARIGSVYRNGEKIEYSRDNTDNASPCKENICTINVKKDDVLLIQFQKEHSL